MRIIQCAAAARLVFLFGSNAVNADEGYFDLGITGGYGSTKIESAVYPDIILESEIFPEKDKSFSGGVFARYTLHLEDGWFLGAHIGWNKEPAKVSQDYDLYYVLRGSSAVSLTEMEVAGETDWTADFLLRAGFDAGGFKPYAAAGVSLLRGEVSINLPSFNASVSDTNTHVGYKLALGVETEITDNILMFVQGEYADYGSKTYFSEASEKLSPSTLGVRLGIGYRF